MTENIIITLMSIGVTIAIMYLIANSAPVKFIRIKISKKKFPQWWTKLEKYTTKVKSKNHFVLYRKYLEQEIDSATKYYPKEHQQVVEDLKEQYLKTQDKILALSAETGVLLNELKKEKQEQHIYTNLDEWEL